MVVFCTFWYWKCAFAPSTYYAAFCPRSQLPKVRFRSWGVPLVHFDLEMWLRQPQTDVHGFSAHLSSFSWTSVVRTFHQKSMFLFFMLLHVRMFTWKCASRHTRRAILSSREGCEYQEVESARVPSFSEPTFRPSGATNHGKNTVFRDFPTFSRICSVCPLTLSLLIFSLLIFLFSVPLPCSAFHLSILSEVWLLNFLR